MLSARLSPTALAALLGETSTKAIIAAASLESTAQEAVGVLKENDEWTAKIYSAQHYTSYLSYSSMLQDFSICNPNHYVNDLDRDVLILHSSGTTGLPKPIYNSHAYLLGYATCHDFKNAEEAASSSLTNLPLYHGFGLHGPFLSLSVGQPCILPPSAQLPNGASTAALLSMTRAKSLVTVPFILEEISMLPEDEGVKALLPLNYVAFGGGPLKESVGQKLQAAGVKLLKNYGLTETGPLGLIFNPTPSYDWHYFRLRHDMDLELKTVVGIKAEADAADYYQLVARPPGWKHSFEVQDRLISNPRASLEEFNPVGRTDNLIVLATGEKVLPTILESTLCESEHVKAAITFGDNQFELGIIVEPKSAVSSNQVDQYRELIWPLVLRAGFEMDNHAQLSSKASIIVVPYGRKLPRSDKGSVLRKDAIAAFETEIVDMYKKLESSVNGSEVEPLDLDNLQHDIKNMIQQSLSWKLSEAEWGCDDDLFELGMDSLQAVRLRRMLVASLPSDRTSRSSATAEIITRDFIYRYPTVNLMAACLRGDVEEEIDAHSSIEDYVDRYTPTFPPHRSDGNVVLLTGSTGSLGSYLLASLSSLSNVSRVICLNRVSQEDPTERQKRSLEEKGIQLTPTAWSKIKVLESRSASPRLGLPEDDYFELRNCITHVLHSAWPMDFKRLLPSFEAHFQTLQNLLNLVGEAYKAHPNVHPRLIFISSISVVGQYGRFHNGAAVPEAPISDTRYANTFGYGHAKLICERIIENVAKNQDNQVEVSYVRVGQMSGSTANGYWNTEEHFPALLKSSQYVGALPDIRGSVSWLPVDCAAESLSQLLLAPASEITKMVYHLENPIRQSTLEIMAIVASRLGLQGEKLLPFAEWLDKVCAAREESGEGVLNPNPANKLAGFFKKDFERMGDVVMDTTAARRVSPTLARMDALGADVIAMYIDYWKRCGYLRQVSGDWEGLLSS